MYDFEREYWNYHGTVDASYPRWDQKSGNPNYLKPTNLTSKGCMVIIIQDTDNPAITGSGVYQALKASADKDTNPFAYSWNYPFLIRLYNKTLRTDGANILATAGETYGTRDCTIPTYEEWSAMTTEEQNTFKDTYFEAAGSSNRVGVSIDEYWDVYASIAAIVLGGDYPTDSSYPYYKIWGDLTTSSGTIKLDYDASTDTPTYREFLIANASLFKKESDGVFKAVVIQTYQNYLMKYWTGYNSSGNMTYTTNSKGVSQQTSQAAEYDIKVSDWYSIADANEDYPFPTNAYGYNFDFSVPPTPPFYWSLSPYNNNGYPTTGKNLRPPVLGGFADSPNLHTVDTTRNLKEIGETAFKNTSLSSIKIARDCQYSETSFPEGCLVTFYP